MANKLCIVVAELVSNENLHARVELREGLEGLKAPGVLGLVGGVGSRLHAVLPAPAGVRGVAGEEFGARGRHGEVGRAARRMTR